MGTPARKHLQGNSLVVTGLFLYITFLEDELISKMRVYLISPNKSPRHTAWAFYDSSVPRDLFLRKR